MKEYCTLRTIWICEKFDPHRKKIYTLTNKDWFTSHTHTSTILENSALDWCMENCRTDGLQEPETAIVAKKTCENIHSGFDSSICHLFTSLPKLTLSTDYNCVRTKLECTHLPNGFPDISARFDCFTNYLLTLSFQILNNLAYPANAWCL